MPVVCEIKFHQVDHYLQIAKVQTPVLYFDIVKMKFWYANDDKVLQSRDIVSIQFENTASVDAFMLKCNDFKIIGAAFEVISNG